MESLIGGRDYSDNTLSWHLMSSSCGVHEPVTFLQSERRGHGELPPTTSRLLSHFGYTPFLIEK